MGTLIAKKYPTSLFLKAADHTYVECGSGAKSWSGWGGKTGGTNFNSGSGSTARADAIAQSDEKAQLGTYLINGVCHQAANRILFPASILVSSARGYSLSSSIFGTYGKNSPFNQYPLVSGDIAACIATPGTLGGGRGNVATKNSATGDEQARQKLMRLLYARSTTRAQDPLTAMKSSIDIFVREVAVVLRSRPPSERGLLGVRQAKAAVELEHYRLSRDFLLGVLGAVEFVKGFNTMTDGFQDATANALGERQYEQFFETKRDERIFLADPTILDETFGQGTAAKVYGDAVNISIRSQDQ